jgi:Mn-dependent DtxR family transcriptional regulator
MLRLIVDEDGFLNIDNGRTMGEERILHLKLVRQLQRRGLARVNSLNHVSLTEAGDELAARLIQNSRKQRE